MNAPVLAASYSTELGTMYNSTVEDFLDSAPGRGLRGKVQLVFTSPPYLLNTKKEYGNRQGHEYTEWLAGLAPRLVDLLTPDGSIVVELGNAWVPGSPTMSVLPLKSLLEFLDRGGLHLCQQFVWENPAKLPSPAQWVTIERIRVKDSFTHLWWMSPVERPKAANRNVLVEYSKAMRRLIETGKYNSGLRQSGHRIGKKSFLQDNGGAIPGSAIVVPNTLSNDGYRLYLRERGLKAHPAAMPMHLAKFFIRLLTDEGDTVFDPFGGSNTTGAAAEDLGRCWVATEANEDYVAGSKGRFARWQCPVSREGDIG